MIKVKLMEVGHPGIKNTQEQDVSPESQKTAITIQEKGL